MRIVRTLAMAAAIVAALAAWPQQRNVPPTVDHTQHQVINTPTDGPIPSLVVHLFADTMDGYNLFLQTKNYRFTPENIDDVIVANEGHAHLYVNGEKAARLYSPWRHLPRSMFRDGINRLQVEFNANDHSIWGVADEPIGADILIDTTVVDGDPIVREEVRYTLDWDWGDAKPHPDGGWTAETDQGYLVHVSAGKLVTRGLELLPCHAMPAKSPLASFYGWFPLSKAYAGHGSMLPNASKISDSYTEDLADPQAKFLESRVVTDPEYCQAHYLIARPRGQGLGAVSLELSGTWKRSPGDEATAFAIQSPAAYGEVKPIVGESGDEVRCSIVGGAEIRVVRSLDKLFSGVDLAEPDPSTLGMKVMRSLVSTTRVVHEAPPG